LPLNHEVTLEEDSFGNWICEWRRHRSWTNIRILYAN